MHPYKYAHCVSLQAIKAACEVGSMGDQLSPETLAAADDLYHLCLPATWCRLAGATAPPPNHSLANWLTDLQNRCQHFERILVMVSGGTGGIWLVRVLFQPIRITGSWGCVFDKCF